MKTNSLINYVSKTVLTFGMMVFSSSGLNAWTIQVLNPSTYMSMYDPYSGTNYSDFRSYLTDPGSILTSGSLAGYQIGTSDAVIINAVSGGNTYSAGELAALGRLLNSNTRVLVFGENNGWQLSNTQLATLLGGTAYQKDGNNSQTLSNAYPLITDGVSAVKFGTPGGMNPNGNGLSFFSDNGMSLWGNDLNFLLLMDVNILENSYAAGANSVGTDNNRLARNVANWLSGIDLAPIPEPSAYAMVFGLITLAGISLRRRRK